MECAQVREEIVSVATGDSTAATRDLVLEHLRQCPSCARHEAGVRNVLEALRDAPDPAPSPAVWAAIERESSSPAAEGPRPLLPRRPAFPRAALASAAAAALLAAGAAVWYAALPTQVPSLPPIATVIPSPGAEVVIIPEKGIFTNVGGGAPLHLGHTLQVLGSAGAVLRTHDGVQVYAAPGTYLRFGGGSHSVERYLTLEWGAVVVDSGNGSPLPVEACGARILPMGTRFSVAVNSAGAAGKAVLEEVTVGVEEGRVRLSTDAGQVDVPAGHLGRVTGQGGIPTSARDLRAFTETQRIREAAAPSGLRLSVELMPPTAPGKVIPFTVRLEKSPGAGESDVRLATVGGGQAYLTCVSEPPPSETAAAPAPGFLLDPSRLVESGDLARGMVRISADRPYEISGELEWGRLGVESGAPGGTPRILMAYICRRPEGDPRAWSGQLTTPPVSVSPEARKR